jgi:hypothetical protein
MGMVSDFVDGIGDWFNKTIQDYLIKGITSCFSNVQDILQTTYTSATEDKGLIAAFLTRHPAKFTGTGKDINQPVSKLWSTIETLCNDVIVPIAGFILTIILLSELIQVVMRGNNFKEFDDSIFIKWIIKAVCGILLVSNSYYIASGLLGFGSNACEEGISTILGTSSLDNTNFALAFETALKSGSYENGELLIMLLLSFVIMIAMFALTVAIILIMASRMIQIFMYLGVSPIPMATMMNESWNGIGKNWIKNMIALSFQGIFIVIALGIFKSIFKEVISGITSVSSGTDIIMSMLMLAGYAGALIFTVVGSGNTSKSIFNAS